MQHKQLPARLKKILHNLPPCQERQIKIWFSQPSGVPPFILCHDHVCDSCALYRATMITICPYCETSAATTMVIPDNGFALCRIFKCICDREYRVVFANEFCNVCELKAKCLSIPITVPELCLHEKIK